MGIKLDFNNSKQMSIVKDLLTNAVFDEFSFNTGFTLFFVCDRSKKINGKNLPARIALSIESEWWFGEKTEWINTVSKLTKGYGFIEPEEPVLAYKLAALRWNGNSTITAVKLLKDRLILDFNDETITISNQTIEDRSWEIWEMKNCYTDDNDQWYVICDNDIFLNIPKN